MGAAREPLGNLASEGRRTIRIAAASIAATAGVGLFVGGFIVITAEVPGGVRAALPFMLLLGLLLSWWGITTIAVLLPTGSIIQKPAARRGSGPLVTVRTYVLKSKLWLDTSFPVYQVDLQPGRVVLIPAFWLTWVLPTLELSSQQIASEKTRSGAFGRSAVRLSLVDGRTVDLAGITPQRTAQLEVALVAALNSSSATL